MHEIYIIEWVIIVWSLVLIDLSTARVRCGATVQKCRKFSLKQVVTKVILVVSRDFSFGLLGNLFSHKSIGKLLNLWDDGKKNSLCKIAIIKIIIMSLQHHNHHGLHSLNLASLGVFLFRCLIALQTATAYDEKYVNQL